MNLSAQKAFAIGITSLVAIALPGFAAAQAAAQTTQVLPPGGTSCAPLAMSAITPHVVDGALHSFDVTVGDASYVAVLAQVGGEGVPFNYMTRFNHGGGVVRHHTDLQTTPIRGALPVTLILLSSPAGSPTCLTTIAFAVSPTGAVLAPSAATGTMGSPAAGAGTTSPAPSAGASSGTPSRPGTSGAGSSSPGTSATTSATSSTTTAATPVSGGLTARIQNMCTGNNSLQLWFLLLAIYVVIAALTALARPPLAQKAFWVPLVLILVPLVLLLGLWYFVPLCRTAGWVPAVSVIIAIAALLVAYRDQNPSVTVIPLPAAKPKDAPKANVPAVVTKSAPTTTKTELSKSN